MEAFKTIEQLKTRETEVLYLLAQGYSCKQSATKLYLSHHTVISYKRNLLRKFNANNTAHLIALASHKGLLNRIFQSSHF